MAKYFNATTDYFLGNEISNSEHYYLNEDTAELAQEIFDNEGLKILTSASRN